MTGAVYNSKGKYEHPARPLVTWTRWQAGPGWELTVHGNDAGEPALPSSASPWHLVFLLDIVPTRFHRRAGVRVGEAQPTARR